MIQRLRLIWALVFVAVLAACSPYPHEAEHMTAAIEQATAIYGDGNLLDEIDTVLFIPGLAEASEYYAGKKQYDKAALAALFNGYTERDIAKEAAMVSFKKAEHYGELTHDSLIMARAEYWMGKFLYNEGREEEALSAFKTSITLFGNRSNERTAIENSLAVTYMMIGLLDSAEMYLQSGLLNAQNGCLDDLEWKILNNYTVFYRIQGKYHQALACIKSVFGKPWLNDSKLLYVYLNLGNTFMALNELDSASVYFQKLETVLKAAVVKDETKVSAYDALFHFAKAQNNDSLALQYREKHEDALFEVMTKRQEQTIYHIQKQYDYETLQNTMNKEIIRRHQVILVFGFVLLVLSVIILILEHRHNQLLRAEEEMRRQLDAMKEDLRQTVNASVVDKTVVSQLKTIIVANRAMHRTKDPKNEWRPLLMEVMAGKENAFEAAKTVIEAAYPDLFSVILEKHPYLSDTEAKVCMMSCFDLTNSEIAEVLGLSTNTVNQSRSNLRKKLNLRPDKLSEQLRDIISK